MAIRQSIALLLAVMILAPAALADYWRSDWNKVDPILECVKRNNDASYTAYFGYNNADFETVKISLGYFNRFSPRPWDRGQTTVFQPGRVVKSFSVNFDGNDIVWILNERRVTASKDSRSCHTGGNGNSQGGSGNSGGNSGNSESNSQNEVLEDYQGDEEQSEESLEESVYEETEELSIENEEGEEQNDEEWEEETYEEIPQTPEYTTIGAALVLIGAGFYMHYKKNQKRSFKGKR